MRKRITKTESVFSWKDNKVKYNKATGVVLTKNKYSDEYKRDR
jgi:hypothetical protein